ncbi:MAG TPA: NAD(P)-dependent oxidoreductase [Solirubrobacteraceae bacterium]|jgi:nucleoside-diphosphate-sugar epimerase|nr:NAD(P)-dependent oxidoreductase [Solirubrobacteraceae bacterium]
MRVFVAGASGVIGRRLLPQLIAAGHEVTGMTRSPAKVEELRAAGAQPVIADALDAPAVRAVVSAARPDAVIHQLTALPRRINPRTIVKDFETNDRLRSEGTRILVDAAQEAGVTRILAQSIAFAYAPRPSSALHVEQDPLYVDSPKQFRRSARALAALEQAVEKVGGVTLRYGYFYGPGSSFSADGTVSEDLERRRMPIVGSGAGVWSFVHVDDAAAATVAALITGGPGAYNIVDDDPAPVSEWLPALAEALGAPRPLRVPAWLARPIAGSYGMQLMTSAQGASNALAKQDLGWAPAYPSWREGFRSALG